jgi:transposase
VQAKRRTFVERLRTIQPEQLVFVDEMGSHIGMIPSHARSVRGNRAFGVIRRNYGSNVTTIAALGVEGVMTSLAFEGATDGASFEVFVRQVLVPELRAGQVVVWDNLSSHYRESVKQAVTHAGCEVWFLPPYSPDLNPIEECFSKLKTWLRQVGAQSVDDLIAAIGQGFDHVSRLDVQGWFRHSGILV